jgi:hypothetical protein
MRQKRFFDGAVNELETGEPELYELPSWDLPGHARRHRTNKAKGSTTMEKQIEKYEHHGELVSVFSEVRGKHREFCLCFQGCARFKPGQPDNCEIAQATFENCVKYNTVTPMWECPKYESI